MKKEIRVWKLLIRVKVQPPNKQREQNKDTSKYK